MFTFDLPIFKNYIFLNVGEISRFFHSKIVEEKQSSGNILQIHLDVSIKPNPNLINLQRLNSFPPALRIPVFLEGVIYPIEIESNQNSTVKPFQPSC